MRVEVLESYADVILPGESYAGVVQQMQLITGAVGNTFITACFFRTPRYC